MEVIVQPTAKDVYALAAEQFRHQLRQKPGSVLGMATGSTPIGVYTLLGQMCARGELDFARVTTFNLDEYLGLGPDHPCSYRRFMQDNLFGGLNIKLENTHVPDGLTRDTQAHCTAYEAMIQRAGGIDLQLLGVGTNGHIGFNEPGSPLDSRTRVENLAPQTITDNARFFGSAEEVPRQCLTMGVGTILDARTCLLLATGAKKAEIVARFIEGPITSDVPASALQRHSHCIVILDEPAAAQLKTTRFAHVNGKTAAAPVSISATA